MLLHTDFLQLQRAGILLLAGRHVESSQSKDGTRVSCIGRQILNHWTTREILKAQDWKGMSSSSSGTCWPLLARDDSFSPGLSLRVWGHPGRATTEQENSSQKKESLRPAEGVREHPSPLPPVSQLFGQPGGIESISERGHLWTHSPS